MLERYVGDDGGSDDEQQEEAPEVAPVELDMTIKRSPKLSTLFITRVPENLTELDSVIGTKDARRVREKAHKLKGSCLAVGAEIMAREAECMQVEAEQGDLERAAARAATLWSQYDRVSTLLNEELGISGAEEKSELRPSIRPSRRAASAE
jgi:HPt (histidine-containing phosphotransfer) domain-containing protein